MNLEIRVAEPGEAAVLRTLVSDPSLAGQFDKFQGAGFEHKLHDPVFARDALHLAFADGEPAGFAIAWVLAHERDALVMARVAVLERFRRRGIGSRLANALLAFAGRRHAGLPLDAVGSAWLPNQPAEAFAASLGFVHLRWFWLMERPRGGRRAPRWPEGVVTRKFDGSERAIRDWTSAYNDSFSEHFRYSPASVEDTRTRTSDPTFRPDGLLLAYRGEECLGFCRNELHASRGEIGILGTTHAARGIGLGRALLRWGVGWLETESALPVTLIVDGENENALGLYRDEGFQVTRTRRSWGRIIDARHD